MACLGMGNGAVFQLVPQRFQRQIGAGDRRHRRGRRAGRLLAADLLGNIKQTSGSFGPGFFVLAVVAAGAAVSLYVLAAAQQGWRLSWHTSSPAEALEEV